MKALDTNVLVRYLVQDNPAQSAKANEIVEREESLFLNCIVLCELVWVLESAYQYEREVIADVLEKILITKQFEIDGKEEAWMALSDYDSSRADFADCLIGRRNLSMGCETTVSFDKRASQLDFYQQL